ncbi:hypothetical protein A2U01_0087518, partial [Trifolium medium]|nr:hypothetical protein [Trifolium medium]
GGWVVRRYWPAMMLRGGSGARRRWQRWIGVDCCRRWL